MQKLNGSARLERDVVMPIKTNGGRGNAIGLPGGAFGFQMRFAQVLHTAQPGHSTVDPQHRSDLSHTEPIVDVPENANWRDPNAIVSFHPRGHLAYAENADLQEEGWNFRPTIAVTRSTFRHPSIARAVEEKRLFADGRILHKDGSYTVTDVNIDPAWNLEGVARRIGMDVMDMRQKIVEFTDMFPELITRPDVPYLLPPIDGQNIHIFGDVGRLESSRTEVGARSHDFCRDGDNFAQRCTCAPSKEYAIEELIKISQAGGVGILVMNPEEGRNFGSVIKHLVYNKREAQPGGDRAERYFECTKEVAGGEDARMHWNKADPFKWLMSHPHIHHWFSESPHKRGLMEAAGVEIGKQYDLPKNRIPTLAAVEMDAKHASGYGGKPRA
jgi:GTP cyclohydrolase II